MDDHMTLKKAETYRPNLVKLGALRKVIENWTAGIQYLNIEADVHNYLEG